MDFKGWMKLKEDSKTCTLQHPKGHTMTIALKALPAIHREQIKRLKFAEGGEVEDGKQRHDNERGVHKPAEQPPKLGSQFGKARHFRRSAAGDHVNEAGLYQDIPARADKSHKSAIDEHHKIYGQLKSMKNPNLKGLAKGGEVENYGAVKRKNYDEGTPDQPVNADSKNDSYDSGQPQAPVNNITVNTTPAPGAAPVNAPASMSTPVNPAAELASTPVEVTPPAPIQALPNNNPNGQPNPLNISKNAQLIPEAEKDVAIAQSKGDVQNLSQLNQGLGKNMQQYQDRFNDMAGHVNALDEYMQKNPINPKHYQENMGSGAKTAAALGLFFGGIATPFGGHNFANDFLNKQIDRDIQGQISRADQQKTIYGAYRDLYGEGKEAYAATKATMFDIANNRQKIFAAQLGTPAAAVKSAALSNELAISRMKALGEGATPLSSLPGSVSAPNQGGGSAIASPKQPNIQNHQGNNSGPASRPDRVLNPEAHKAYEWAMNKYNHVQSQQEKDAIQQEYLDAQQVDEQLDQIDKLYPQLVNKATYGGYLAEKINPTVIGAGAAAAAEAAGALGAPATGGASLLAAVPAALGAGAVAGGGASAMKQALTAIGGQQQTQYETASDSLKTLIGAALSKSKLTPTELSEISDHFLPTKIDSKETAADKLEKLKAKIVSVTRKGTLKSLKMTNGK